MRSRIVAAVVALLSVAFACVAMVTTLVVHRVLLDRLDEELRAAGSRFAVGLENGDPDHDNDPVRYQTVAGQAAGTLGARVLDGRVTVAAVVGRGATARPSAAAKIIIGRLQVTGRPQTVELPGLGDYRVLVADGRDSDYQVTGLPLKPVYETTAQLVLIEGVVFAVALVLVALTSAASVGLTLRPLRRITETAARVGALPLASGTVSLPDRAPAGPAGSEVETLSTAFNAMLEQIESALLERHASEERLRRFIADASHELRTPVAVVRSHAELAQRSGGADLDPEIRHALRRITAQTQRMGNLVDDLLLLARLDSGRALAAEPVDLTKLVLEAVEDARIRAPGHRWRLRLPDRPVVVTGDPTALHQVIANLLANAHVHTPAGTAVVTTVGTVTGDGTSGEDHAQDGRSSARLSIDDDGPGVPAAIADRVFDRFVHGERRSSGTGSSGLGLAIVAAVVVAHRGTVSLRPATPGTSVIVHLPCAPDDTPEGASERLPVTAADEPGGSAPGMQSQRTAGSEAG